MDDDWGYPYDLGHLHMGMKCQALGHLCQHPHGMMEDATKRANSGVCKSMNSQKENAMDTRWYKT